MQRLTSQIVKSLANTAKFSLSYKNSLINAPPVKYSDRQALKQNVWRDVDPTHEKSQISHLSNAQVLIHKIPVVYSNENTIRCIGGTEIGTGHPQVYIQLNTRTHEPVSCKWCGIKYALRHH